MSKKETTTGEEFENFLNFAMSYNFKKKKEKKWYKPSEVRKIYQQNGMTDEMMYQRLIALGADEKEARRIVQKILHPTEEELVLEATITDTDLEEIRRIDKED